LGEHKEAIRSFKRVVQIAKIDREDRRKMGKITQLIVPYRAKNHLSF